MEIRLVIFNGSKSRKSYKFREPNFETGKYLAKGGI
jgi:hypothetical protein